MGLFAKFKKDRGEKRPHMGYERAIAILRGAIEKRSTYNPAFGLTGSIDDKTYEFMNSNLYKNLCLLYLGAQKFDFAKRYAEKRLAIVEDCPVASRVLGTCLLNEYVDGGNIIANIVENNEPRVLKETVRSFRNCLRADEEDYFCLFGIALASFLYNIWADSHGCDTDQTLVIEGQGCLTKLIHHAKESEEAELMRRHFWGYFEIVKRFIEGQPIS
ncbi:MAG: hypothetical protein JSV50_02035 [Desulfobacteraceae bacterium]|nr:MAG: hypothetical protein JSV50_02035 [Desulfobacteraceae bacterium]